MLAPENEEVWGFFCLMGTQLRSVGMGGIIGLDYGVLDTLFDYYSVPMWRRAALLDDIRIVEAIATKEWNKDTSGTKQRPDSTRADPRRRVR